MKKIILNSRIEFSSTAEASIDYHNVNKIDFIITDDKPNKNNVGIKASEFYGLASSAIFMPIKIEDGDHSVLDHYEAVPVGVITESKIEGASVSGSGVLWPKERPAAVALIKDKVSKQEAFLSWEIAYSEEETDDTGVLWLKDPKILGIAIVSYPAYGERTPIVRFSSSDGDEGMSDNVEEVLEETVEVEEIETVETEVVEETTDVEETSDEPVEENEEETSDMEQELSELRRFKFLVERGKVVRSMLGDVEDSDIDVLVDLSDDQLSVVKKLVSSRKVSKASEKREPATPIIKVPPAVTITEPEDAKSVLRKYLED